ncbi:MAG: amino acid adenylation domain-containing protein, partial [Burkholderiales bacterium]
LARGYLNRPELTAERFVADPWQPGERLYRTGDLARRRVDGTLLFAGRADSQVKIRGQRIEPGEIEATLLRCQGVRQAAVAARANARGECELLACVVADAFDERALREQLRQWLPAGLLPAALVAVPALPLLPSGKLDVRAWPAPQADTAAIEPPLTDTERRLHAIWCELLGRDAVARHDNFFEYGGHSLTATRLVARIRVHLGADLPLRAVFEHPTIASLALAIDAVLASAPARHLTPIQPVSRQRVLPLSHSQQRMWLVQQMDPQGAAYHMPFALRIAGELRSQALRQALAHLVVRHEALRTSLHLERGALTQRIAAQVHLPMAEVDLSALPAANAEERARELAQQESRRSFDLGSAPLARALLVTLSEQDHVLLIVIHHAIGDQWSGGVLARELALAYEAALAGRAPQWGPLRIQYADYCVWQREEQGDESLESELAYWRERLRGTPVLALPTDQPAASDGSPSVAPQGASLVRELPASVIDGVRRLAVAHGATPFMVLLAGFKLLLARYCNQHDIAVGSPIANRLRADTEDLVGTMVNTLVLRTDLSGDPSFVELLSRVKETALGAYAHQNLPYERLVDALRGERGASPAHVRALFNVPNAPWVRPRLGSAEVTPFEFDRGAAQFDLSVTVDTEHFHRIHFEYATALFSPGLLQQLATHYLHLLQQALAQPESRLSSFATLTPLELQAEQQRHRLNVRALPAAQRIDELIAMQAARTPQAVALSQGAQRLNYAELDARACRLAHHLQRLGVTRGTLVGLCLQRTPDMVVALLAVMKAGGAFVPLDPAFPRDRLRFMVDDSGLPLVITHAAVAEPPAPRPGGLLDLDAQAQHIADLSDAVAPTLAGQHDLAYVLYTSGSTGRPKGVEIEHRSLLNFIASMQREPGLSAGDTLLAVTTLSFDIAGLELLLPLTLGARVELATRDEATDPRLLIERLAAVRPTMMQATPATWTMLLAAGWNGDPNLVALCGGEPLPAELAARLLARCKALWNLYGPTETTIWSTIDRVQANAPITIGRPIDNTSTWVLDACGQPVPPGVTGELTIGGLGVARGYRNRPELTAQRFVPDRFSDDPQARLYRTGDLARRLPDGRLVHLGRNDLQVKVRGFRIEPGEIESVLARHAEVAQCAVAAKTDATGTQQLVAYVVLRPAASFDAVALRTHLRAQLPEYMVPNAFIALDALPLTANRKVDVNALPAPKSADLTAHTAREADPHGVLAVQLLALWRQVLDNDGLGLHDNFFDSGGHSLKAVQLLTLVERVFGRRLPLATLIEAPTVAQLEQAMGRADWVPPWRSLIALAVHGTRTPLYLVPGVGGNVLGFTLLAKLLDGERPVYGLQARGLDGVEQPLRSVAEMAEHHLREIRLVQPHGPYLVGGACTGGVIAFEIARRLHEQGERVELIVMESWHPASYRRPSGPEFALQTLRFAIGRLRAVLRTLAALPLRRWPSILRRAWFGARLVDGALEESLAGNDYLADRVVAATFEAVATYDARPFGGRLLNVIAASRPLANTTLDTRREWGALARQGAHSVEMPAEDSGQLFVAPHVGPLANLLRRHVGHEL